MREFAVCFMDEREPIAITKFLADAITWIDSYAGDDKDDLVICEMVSGTVVRVMDIDGSYIA